MSDTDREALRKRLVSTLHDLRHQTASCEQLADAVLSIADEEIERGHAVLNLIGVPGADSLSARLEILRNAFSIKQAENERLRAATARPCRFGWHRWEEIPGSYLNGGATERCRRCLNTRRVDFEPWEEIR